MPMHMSIRDDKAILSVQGRFDFNVHSDFRKHTEEALMRRGVKSIEINLADVSYLDSSALGMLLLLREKAGNTGKSAVSLAGVKGLVAEVLEVANFGRLFRIG